MSSIVFPIGSNTMVRGGDGPRSRWAGDLGRRLALGGNWENSVLLTCNDVVLSKFRLVALPRSVPYFSSYCFDFLSLSLFLRFSFVALSLVGHSSSSRLCCMWEEHIVPTMTEVDERVRTFASVSVGKGEKNCPLRSNHRTCRFLTQL